MSEQDTPKAEAKQVPEREYAIYEAHPSEGDPSGLAHLTLVTNVRARTERDARWLAVARNKSLGDRTTPQDGKEAEGVRLVAIEARYVGEPVLTREELDVRTVRR